jgi:hypothetical protein
MNPALLALSRPEFKSESGSSLFGLRLLVTFLSASRQILGYCLEIDHHHFSLCPHQFRKKGKATENKLFLKCGYIQKHNLTQLSQLTLGAVCHSYLVEGVLVAAGEP